MSSLARTQRLFAASLDIAPDKKPGDPFPALLTVGGSMTPVERIGVYRNNSRGARLRALEAVYPVCLQILGANCFRAMAADYLDASPSTRGDLNLFGDALPSFLRRPGRIDTLVRDLPYLPDLARLEWLWHALYYAADDPPFDMDAFARSARGEGGRRLRFRLSSALALFVSDYPIHEIWRRHREGQEAGAVEMGAGDRLVLVRERYRPQVLPVDVPTYVLLERIAAGRTLGALEAEGVDLDPLPRLIQSGWIAGIEPRTEG